jgi:hypothetical protein
MKLRKEQPQQKQKKPHPPRVARSQPVGTR